MLTANEKGTSGSPDWLWDGNKQAPTLAPSIRRMGGCAFHGYLQAGVWNSAGDGAPVSAQVYRGGPHHPIEPRRNLMTETSASEPATKAADPATDAAAGETKAPEGATHAGHPVVDEAPTGHSKLPILAFINGLLHQLHTPPHEGNRPVWVPVPGTAWPPGLAAHIEQLVEAKFAAFKAGLAGSKPAA